jgi:hypothetical protein
MTDQPSRLLVESTANLWQAHPDAQPRGETAGDVIERAHAYGSARGFSITVDVLVPPG